MARTTTSSTRKTAAKKAPAARKATAKKTPTRPAAKARPAPVDLRHPLPVRRRVFVGPMGAHEQAAIRAALASAAARLPIPVRAWNGPTAHLANGTVLTHTPHHATTDQTPQFTAHIPCRHGATHQHLIHTARDLAAARTATNRCDGLHGATPPKPAAILQLREGIQRATASAADTQPLSRDDIDTGLAARAAGADTDQPKEHPQP
ncbi:hypothetical protein [Streptomyces caniscabiei]|uniref:hypothetical protein n=1 Tax=Streptomyces caniscabiei TaxID=2746961 RepID=UPI001872F637|nr:hypothetical protein [Streptomyces caniscabiei]MBE4761801.1 hypothetical protein [Streptomyces caniscabiei]MDX2947920.1 hypothetical protein [Streptomyces caniscabiei]